MRIQAMDDSLRMLYGMVRENKLVEIPTLNFIEAINRQLAFYHNYPEDQYSAECLDRALQLYTQMKAYPRALAYSDTLLDQYPNYNRRTEVMLNAGSIADAILNNRTKAKAYYEKLLKEVPELNGETKELVEFRLEHIDLSFEKMIELRQ